MVFMGQIWTSVILARQCDGKFWGFGAATSSDKARKQAPNITRNFSILVGGIPTPLKNMSGVITNHHGDLLWVITNHHGDMYHLVGGMPNG